ARVSNRHSIDQRLGRLIADKLSCELCCDELCGVRVVRKDVDHHLAVLLATAGGNLMTKDGLLAVVVHERSEHKAAALSRPIDRPPGETSRDFLNVLLGVAAVDSDRVKLHQLASVVLVYSGLSLCKLSLRLRRARLLIASPHLGLALELTLSVDRIVYAKVR